MQNFNADPIFLLTYVSFDRKLSKNRPVCGDHQKKDGLFDSMTTRLQQKMYEFHWKGGTKVEIRYCPYVKFYRGSEFHLSMSVGSQQSAEK